MHYKLNTIHGKTQVIYLPKGGQTTSKHLDARLSKKSWFRIFPASTGRLSILSWTAVVLGSRALSSRRRGGSSLCPAQLALELQQLSFSDDTAVAHCPCYRQQPAEESSTKSSKKNKSASTDHYLLVNQNSKSSDISKKVEKHLSIEMEMFSS